ncbi:MAG TPA: hypothetical protein PKJ68_04500 [Candidatus Woesebacteria bacterium]|nr:hypothetical protein [Candidatus Woesebacteria bacterium]
MFRTYRTLALGEFIVVAVDTAAGMGDYTAAQYLSKTKIDVPIVYHSKTTTSDFIPHLAESLNKIYDITRVQPIVALERGNGGAFLIDRLGAINLLQKYRLFAMPKYGTIDGSEPTVYGWDTSSTTRPKMLQDLKDVIDKKALGVYDKTTIQELYSFVLVQTSTLWKAQAERGSHDDLVMSLAIAYQMFQSCEAPKPLNDPNDQFPDENIFDKKSGFYV